MLTVCRLRNNSNLRAAGGPKGAKGSIFIYSVTANSWTVSDSALNVPRSDACMAAVGDQLYLAGVCHYKEEGSAGFAECFISMCIIWIADCTLVCKIRNRKRMWPAARL